MRILLPPSESKRPNPSQAGPRHDDGAGPLGPARSAVLSALVEFAAAPGAAAALRLPARSAAADLADNQAVRTAARMPAIERYAGTVYDGLDVRTLTAAGRRRADASVLIFSGLWGVARADELLPSYRLPAAAALPGVGVLASYWRPVLDEALPSLLTDGDDGGLIVDLRSTDYAAMWRPRGSLRDRVVPVRVLSPRPGAEPAVISYPSKLGKGKLARALLARRARVSKRAHLVDAWLDSGGADGWLRTDGSVDLLI